MVDIKPHLILATRLHLGRATAPPPEDRLKTYVETLAANAEAATTENRSVQAVIAVDATPKVEGYDFVRAVRECAHASQRDIHVLPVTPWGKFVPALNAIVLHAASLQARRLLLLSAEVSTSASSIEALCDHVDEDGDVLVAGAALPGHDYRPGESNIPLNGRTCPWNTLAVWNVPKLSLTGFSTVSDMGDTAGVEECAAIAISQKVFGESSSKAKLVKLPDVQWEADFGNDAERLAWHESKMNSKLSRAQAQMDKLGLSGTVIHC